LTLGDAVKTGVLTFEGAGTLTSNTTLTAASDVAFTGALGGAFSLTKAGSGVVTLGGPNTFTGAVTVSAGVLRLTGGLAVDDSAAVAVSGGATLRVVADETVGSLAGAGSVDLSLGGLTVGGGASTSYSGVMITFASIAAAGDVNVNAIAPGIAAALVATVAGLFVAIPAMFGYNYLTSKIKEATTDMHVFVDEFITKVAEFYRE
jgi:autotransporter-associated beta strand protein